MGKISVSTLWGHNEIFIVGGAKELVLLSTGEIFRYLCIPQYIIRNYAPPLLILGSTKSKFSTSITTESERSAKVGISLRASPKI